MEIKAVFFVFLGGGIGSVLRYFFHLCFQEQTLFQALLPNLIGCLLLGIFTPLILSEHEMLKLMLDQGLSPNKKCEDGNTPLHFAFMIFDEKMMKTLFSYGANDTIKNRKGESVKKLASQYHCNLKKLKK